jgi:hypothetical protein
MKDLGKKCAIDVINLKINEGLDCVPHMHPFNMCANSQKD